MGRWINVTMTDSMVYAYPWRAKAAIAVVLLMATLAVGTLAAYRTVTRNAATDEIALDEQRFEGLRRALPRRGIIGYFSDSGGGLDGVRAYYRTQYFLAPVVVAPDEGHELVVANFSSPFTVAEFAAAHGLSVAQDFGNGVALLRSGRR
jgi:hypothetical protein